MSKAVDEDDFTLIVTHATERDIDLLLDEELSAIFDASQANYAAMCAGQF